MFNLSSTGQDIAKSTKLLSKNGTRVSRELLMLILSSTTNRPCKKVFASKYKELFILPEGEVSDKSLFAKNIFEYVQSLHT